MLSNVFWTCYDATWIISCVAASGDVHMYEQRCMNTDGVDKEKVYDDACIW